MPEPSARATTWRRWGLTALLLRGFVEWLARFSGWIWCVDQLWGLTWGEKKNPKPLAVGVFLASLALFLRTADWLLR